MAVSPPLSVLLPVRNGEKTLSHALESLARQTFSDFEVILVNDGSTDRTMDLAETAAMADSRIHVFHRDPAGIVPALEFARSKARGTFLARMDADDGAFAARFEQQMAFMSDNPTVSLSGTGVVYFPREVVRGGALRYERWINSVLTHSDVQKNLFVECPIPHPTFMIRAHVLDLVGGYRDQGWPEDYDLVFRLWEGGGRFGKIPEVLLRWREGRARLSRTHEAYSEGAFRRCKVHFLRRTHLRGGRGVIVWGAGPVGKAFARELVAQGGNLRAFVDLDPRKVGQDIHGVRVLTPDQALSVSDAFSVAAVAKPGGRDEIRQALEHAGNRELKDFVAVA